MGEERIIRSFEDLECWKAGRDVRLFVAKVILPVLPKEERYRLGDQLLRAARSITANIAEGYGLLSAAELSKLKLVSADLTDPDSLPAAIGNAG